MTTQCCPVHPQLVSLSPYYNDKGMTGWKIQIWSNSLRRLSCWLLISLGASEPWWDWPWLLLLTSVCPCDLWLGEESCWVAFCSGVEQLRCGSRAMAGPMLLTVQILTSGKLNSWMWQPSLQVSWNWLVILWANSLLWNNKADWSCRQRWDLSTLASKSGLCTSTCREGKGTLLWKISLCV